MSAKMTVNKLLLPALYSCVALLLLLLLALGRSTNAQTVITYTYDAAGNRVQESVICPSCIPVAGAVSATVAFNSSANPIALNITGSATSAAVSTQAAHGKATASGTSITYTPNAGYSGGDSFAYTASNAFGTSQPATVSITVGTALQITTTTLPTPVLTQSYSHTVATSGGTAPISFSVYAGSLPAGLSLASSTGVISGTPTASGAYSFTIKAADSSSLTATQAYSGTIAALVTITTTSLPAPTLNQSYSQTIQTSGGTAPISFSISAGALPTGLSLASSSGVISGTATASGSYSFTVKATDANGLTATQAYSVTVAGAPIANNVSATVEENSTSDPITLNITGGTATSVAVSTQASHGVATASGTSITYTPTSGYTGSDSFQYTATNSAGTSAAATASITVNAPPIAVNQSFSMLNSDPPTTFTITGDSSPEGYTLSISSMGTPSKGTISNINGLNFTYTYTGTVGTDTFSYTITDGHGGTATATITVTITRDRTCQYCT
jgi:hypothetical protein